jgi:hypothetical protein
MNSYLKFVFSVSIAIVFANTILAQDISVEAKLQNDTIIIGDHIDFTIEVKAPNSASVAFPEFKTLLATKVEIVVNNDVTKEQDKDFSIYKKHFVITSFDTDTQTIPPIEIKIVSPEETSSYYTNEISFFVKSFIKLDDIPVDTIYSKTSGFILIGRNGFEQEIENIIPDSIKNSEPPDSLISIKHKIKQMLIPMIASNITQHTNLSDQDEILKIIDSPIFSIFVVDKGGILEKYDAPGNIDTLFVGEFEQVEVNQPLFTINRIMDINDELHKTPYNLSEFWFDLKYFVSKFWWILLTLAIITLTILYYFLYYKNNKKPTILKIKAKDPAHIIALEKLQKIKDNKLWLNNDIKEYYVQITDILREYIENRFGFRAKEMVSSEIIEILYNNRLLINNDLEKLKNILNASDFVKFAKYQPSQNDNISSLEYAFDIVENTKEIVDNNSNIKQVDAEIELIEEPEQNIDKNSEDND